MSLTPGTRLGVYEVIAAIGEGGMGQVYRARDTRPELAREVAIKVLLAASGSDDSRRRFEQEARAMAALNHPNILAIYDVGTHPSAGSGSAGTLYLVEEFLDGDTRSCLATPRRSRSSSSGSAMAKSRLVVEIRQRRRCRRPGVLAESFQSRSIDRGAATAAGGRCHARQDRLPRAPRATAPLPRRSA